MLLDDTKTMCRNPYKLPRRCVVWEGGLKDDRPCILHQIIVVEKDIWCIIEDESGALQKVKISRLRLVPVENESEHDKHDKWEDLNDRVIDLEHVNDLNHTLAMEQAE